MDQSLHEKVRVSDNIPARGIFYRSSNQVVTNHWHNSLEIIALGEGCMEVGVADDIYQCHSGDIMIIDSGAIHYTQVLEPSVIYAIQIPYQIMQAHIPNYEYVCFRSSQGSIFFPRGAEADSIKNLIIQYNEIEAEKPLGYSLRCSSILYELIYRLYTCHLIEIDKNLKGKNEWHMNRIKQVISYVNQNYMNPISLSEAADLLSLNPEYFCRYFKKYTGYTFLDYVNATRLTHIANELKNTSASITELTEKHGFTNYKLFLKMFRKTYGCTPIEYKRSNT